MTITVIVRNEYPLRYLNEPATYRSVRLELTPEQAAQLRLRHADEVIGQCFVEPEDTPAGLVDRK